jgi:hypothetical protein
MSVDARIDELVERLDSSGVPIWPIDAAPWVDEIESRLKLKLPAEYRSLVTRYSFPVITFQTVELFANRGDRAESDISVAPFHDAHLSRWLTSHGLFQVGRLASGSYDPVCVDASSKDPSVLLVDHEGALQDRSKVRRTNIASSIGAILGERIDA